MKANQEHNEKENNSVLEESTVVSVTELAFAHSSGIGDTGSTPPADESFTRNPYLPETFQRNAEKRTGHAFQDVNIYTNSHQAEADGARAFTYGNDIHFAKNEFNPYTNQGKELIEHELAHVVQQREDQHHLFSQKTLEQDANKGMRSVGPTNHSFSNEVSNPIVQYKFREITAEKIGQIRALLKSENNQQQNALLAYKIIRKELAKNKAIEQFLSDYRDIGLRLLKRLPDGKEKTQISTLFVPKLAGIDQFGIEALNDYQIDKRLQNPEEIWVKNFGTSVDALLINQDLDEEDINLENLVNLAEQYTQTDDQSDEAQEAFKNLEIDAGLKRLINKITSSATEDLIEKPTKSKKYYDRTLFRTLDRFGINPKGYHNARLKDVRELKARVKQSKDPNERALLQEKLKEARANKSDSILSHMLNFAGWKNKPTTIRNLKMSELKKFSGSSLMGLEFNDNSTIDEIKLSFKQNEFNLRSNIFDGGQLNFFFSEETQIFAKKVIASNLNFKVSIKGENGENYSTLNPEDEIKANIELNSDLFLDLLRIVSPNNTKAIEKLTLNGISFKYSKYIGQKQFFKPGIQSFITPALAEILPGSFSLLFGYVYQIADQLSNKQAPNQALIKALSSRFGNGENLQFEIESGQMLNFLNVDGSNTNQPVQHIGIAKIGKVNFSSDIDRWNTSTFNQVLEERKKDVQKNPNAHNPTAGIDSWKKYQLLRNSFNSVSTEWTKLKTKNKKQSLSGNDQVRFSELNRMHKSLSTFEEYRKSRIDLKTEQINGNENEAVLSFERNEMLNKYFRTEIEKVIDDQNTSGLNLKLSNLDQLGNFEVTKFSFSSYLTAKKAMHSYLEAPKGEGNPIPKQSFEAELFIPEVVAKEIDFDNTTVKFSGVNPTLKGIRLGISFTLPKKSSNPDAIQTLSIAPINIESLSFEKSYLGLFNNLHSIDADRITISNVILGYNYNSNEEEDAFMLSLGKFNFENARTTVKGKTIEINGRNVTIQDLKSQLSMSLKDENSLGYSDWLHFSKSANGKNQKIRLNLPQTIEFPGITWEYEDGTTIQFGSKNNPVKIKGLALDLQTSSDNLQINSLSVQDISTNGFSIFYDGMTIASNKQLSLLGFRIMNYAFNSHKNYAYQWKGKAETPGIPEPRAKKGEKRIPKPPLYLIDNSDEVPSNYPIGYLANTTDSEIVLTSQIKDSKTISNGTNAHRARISLDEIKFDNLKFKMLNEKEPFMTVDHFNWQRIQFASYLNRKNFPRHQMHRLFAYGGFGSISGHAVIPLEKFTLEFDLDSDQPEDSSKRGRLYAIHPEEFEFLGDYMMNLLGEKLDF